MSEKENVNLLIGYRLAGKDYVSPAEAAPVLGCDPYSLNIAAKAGMMPDGSCYFAGRNLRISVRWLMVMEGLLDKSRHGKTRDERRNAEYEAGRQLGLWGMRAPIQISSQGRGNALREQKK